MTTPLALDVSLLRRAELNDLVQRAGIGARRPSASHLLRRAALCLSAVFYFYFLKGAAELDQLFQVGAKPLFDSLRFSDLWSLPAAPVADVGRFARCARDARAIRCR